MTTGADTDYFLSPERSPNNYQALSRDVLSIVEAVRLQISDSDDLERMRDAVSNLNDVFVQDGLLGKTAQLQSDFSTVISRGVDYQSGALKAIEMPEELSGAAHEGVFIGCDVVPLSTMQPELVYVVELPVDTEGLRFKTVLAAVDDAQLMINEENEESGIGHALELLSRVENDIVAENLRRLSKIYEVTDEVDADFLKEIGLLTSSILSVPEVSESKQLRDAVCELIANMVNHEDWYAFEGFDVEVSERNGGIALGINQIEAVGQIHSVTTIHDFEYIEATVEKAASAIPRQTAQPAFVFLQDDKAYVVPIRYLTLFYVDSFSASGSSCDTARSRFLEENPKIFDEPKGKRKKLARKSIEKYFKNNGGTV